MLENHTTRWASWTSKSGAVGVVLATFGCASCFPAAAALGSALGLGFLGQFEGLFINSLLPIFAGLVAVVNVVWFLQHRRWWRLVAALAGPAMVLATLYLFWTDDWSTWLFYLGVVLIFAVSVWDMWSPPGRQCRVAEGSAHG